MDGSDRNKFNVIEANSQRHTGVGSEAVSGQNEADKVCNIYDLEGNYSEYIAEENNYNENTAFISRGGRCDNNSPASRRNLSIGTANVQNSFRFVLYVM